MTNKLKKQQKNLRKKIEDAVSAKVLSIVESRLTQFADEVRAEVSETETECQNLAYHVDELESEFRHEVHEVQDRVQYAITSDDISEHVDQQIYDELHHNMNVDFEALSNLDVDEVNAVIGALGEVDLDELSDIQQQIADVNEKLENADETNISDLREKVESIEGALSDVEARYITSVKKGNNGKDLRR